MFPGCQYGYRDINGYTEFILRGHSDTKTSSEEPDREVCEAGDFGGLERFGEGQFVGVGVADVKVALTP